MLTSENMIRKSIIVISIFLLCIITLSCGSSDDSNTMVDDDNDCVGINFSPDTCIGEFLSTDGLSFRCDQCTSDLRNEDFGIGFGILMVPRDQAPVGIGTQMVIDGIEGAFIPEFEDCSTINLFSFSVDQMGLAIKDQMVGTLENIETILPDMLSFIINIDGLDMEDTFCGFCFARLRPPCADNL